MAIDISTNVGKVRLRVGDISDIPYLPDSVYTQTLVDTSDNLAQASVICAKYILAQLAFSGHEKMVQLEVWGNDAFRQYKEFLLMTVKDPSFNEVNPIPYVSESVEDKNALVQFIEDWNANYCPWTQSEQLNIDAYNTGAV